MPGSSPAAEVKAMCRLGLYVQALHMSERSRSHSTSASLTGLKCVCLVCRTQGLHAVKGRKQPKDLLPVSAVPMNVVTPSAIRALAHQLFAGYSSLT